jgi:glucokinase
MIRAVGIGVPGAVDVKKGKVLMAPNLGWRNINMRKIMQKKLKLPVSIGNDVDLGVFGEQHYGAAKNIRNVVGVFWGTGIGGGIIISGKLHNGFSQTSGELGHMVADPNGPVCTCGNKGCLESIAGKWAIQRDWRVYQKAKSNTASHKVLRSKQIKEAFLNKDPFFSESLGKACKYLGMSLASIVNLINPEVIVLGGGMIESMENELLPLIREAMDESIFPSAKVTLKTAILGDYAIIAGSAALARQQFN